MVAERAKMRIVKFEVPSSKLLNVMIEGEVAFAQNIDNGTHENRQLSQRLKLVLAGERR